MARADGLEAELAAAKAAAEQRNAELARLQADHSAREAAPQMTVAHVNEEKNLTIAQLNHQVDFLNAQCAAQSAELDVAQIISNYPQLEREFAASDL